MAENVFAVTQTAPGRAGARDRRRSRRPRVAIADADGVLRPEGCLGQILVGGETLFSGYHHALVATAALQDGWYQTGELGFVSVGELYVTGRMDDVLVGDGKNIYAHDVEHAINLHTSVKAGRCVAIGVCDQRTGSEGLTMVAEVEALEAPDGQALKKRIGEVVVSAVGVTLSTVRFVEPGWLAKTTSGKLSRHANLRKYRQEQPGW